MLIFFIYSLVGSDPHSSNCMQVVKRADPRHRYKRLNKKKLDDQYREALGSSSDAVSQRQHLQRNIGGAESMESGGDTTPLPVSSDCCPNVINKDYLPIQ